MLRLWFWWTIHRVLWAILPLPEHPRARDRAIADRTAKVFYRHLDRIPSTATYNLDPYRVQGSKWIASTPYATNLITLAVERSEMIAIRHSLGRHLLSGLMRDADPETRRRSKEVAEQVEREKAAEKERRSIPTLPPPDSGSSVAT